MAKIHDVAYRAGVSPATVSRVYNQPKLVSPATRKRVTTAAAELDYLPNAVARGLATGRSGVVGLIVPDITNPYFGYIARGCSDAFNQRQLTLALYNSEEQSSREDYMRLLIHQRQADGLIITSEAASIDKVSEHISKSQIPTVYIERQPDEPHIDAVYVDNQRAAQCAVEYLLTLGHKKIATITGAMSTMTGKERLQGFLKGLTQAGIHLLDTYIYEGNFKLDGGAAAAEQIMASPDPPTAVFVASDLMAYGAIGAFTSNGWDVPGTISVVGCEDLPFSRYFSPKLTTMRIPIYEIGRHAAQLLIKRLAKPARKASIEVLGAELIIRQSACRADSQ